MVSKAEAKRRRQQSERDKTRHREEQEEDRERERRRRQSRRDRANHIASLILPVWSSISQASRSEPSVANREVTSPSTEFAVEQPAEVPQESNDMASSRNEKDFFRQFCDRTAGMFNNPELADMKIVIGKIEISAHRFVLCLQSKYFADALNGEFLEGSTKTLQCPAQKEHAYLRLLQYLYTGDYEDEPSTLVPNQDDEELLKDPQVYFLADSFFLNNLKDLALTKFEQKLEDLWLTERFVDCIAEVYANTSSGTQDRMRVAIVDTCVGHITQLLPGRAFLALVEKGGDFAVDLMRALAINQGRAKGRDEY